MTFKLTPEKPPYYETAPGGIIIGSYTGLINQTGTANPTAIIFQNSFRRNIIWERQGVGLYSASIEGGDPSGGGGFLQNKTWMQVSQNGPFILMAAQLSPENVAALSSYDASGVLTEGLDNVSIHIILFK